MRSISDFFKGLSRKQKKILLRIIISAIFLILSESMEEKNRVLQILFFAVSYIVIGYDILLRAFKGIKKGHPFDENFLMAVATVGAIALGDLEEGSAVMIFYHIGELFESIAVGKGSQNIADFCIVHIRIFVA